MSDNTDLVVLRIEEIMSRLGGRRLVTTEEVIDHLLDLRALVELSATVRDITTVHTDLL